MNFKQKENRHCHNAVYGYSCTWRYIFNPGKSAVLVYGENSKDRKVGSEYREFNLGKGKVC